MVPATSAVELTDHILLNFNRDQARAAGLTILSFSVLAASTELGPRSFALTGLETLPDEVRDVVVRIITQPPVNRFLKVTSFYTLSAETIPLTYLESPPALSLAV